MGSWETIDLDFPMVYSRIMTITIILFIFSTLEISSKGIFLDLIIV